MEQKKILWIVVAISVFVLIIFGTALVLYAPSRSSVTSREAAVAAPLPGTKQGIDPDSWVRDPNKAPDFDANRERTQGDINLTIVNGDNAGANYGTMDVSGLTSGQQIKTGEQIAPTPQGIPGQDTGTVGQKSDAVQATTESTKVTTTTVTTEKTIKAGTSDKKTTAKTVKAATPAKAPAKATTAAKPVIVTEYWIQAGSFSSKLNAEKARESLAGRYLTAEIFTKEQAGKTSYRVRVGPYKTKTEAEYWLGTLTEIKDFAESYVSEVKAKK
jgi:cell division septation protein DedD